MVLPLRSKLAAEHFELGTRLLARDVWREAAGQARTAVAQVRQQIQSLGTIGAQQLDRGEGQPEALCIRRIRAVERWRGDADNRKRHIVNAEHSANDGGVAGKMNFPESMADDRDTMRISRTILVRQEPSAVHHANAEHIEIVIADKRERRLPLELLGPKSG